MSHCMNCERLMNALEAQYFENCGLCRRKPGMNDTIPHNGEYPNFDLHADANKALPARTPEQMSLEHQARIRDKGIYW